MNQRPVDSVSDRAETPWTSQSDLVIVPGTALHREYRLLGLLALAGIIGFFVVWPLPVPGRHPVVQVLVTLAIVYYVLVWLARWIALRTMRRPRPAEPETGLRVGVATSYVPRYESLSMLEQTVRHLVSMDYPHETWVLDEGNDPAVRALCARFGAQHFTRQNRPEYQRESGRFASNTKHGNYNAWLNEIGVNRYDVFVTFDPDHVPEPDFLLRTLGHFRSAEVGFVQAPQVYYNQSASLIARGAAEETYAYYSSHLMASYGLGHTVVVGSHTAHRARALHGVGGFPPHDAEDLLLTMQYRAEGWTGVYVPDVLASGLAPVDWTSYLRQQIRWSRAVLDLKRHAFLSLASKLSPREKVLNLFHGIYYLRPLLLFPVYAVLLESWLTNVVPPFLDLRAIVALTGLALLLSAIDRFRQRFYLEPDREGGSHWRALLLQVAKAPHLGRTLVDVILDRRVSYVTTPKTEHSSPRRMLALPHMLIGLGAAVSLAIGSLLNGGLRPTLVVVGIAVMAVSFGLAITDWHRFPPPFDPTLWTRVRRSGSMSRTDSISQGSMVKSRSIAEHAASRDSLTIAAGSPRWSNNVLPPP